MATDLRAIDPKAYYQHFLDKDVRPDGRSLVKVRPLSITIDCVKTANGSALVKLGNTTVICGIKAELATPTAMEPDLGFYVPNIDLPPLCSSRFRPGPPSEQAQIYTQMISDVLQISQCIRKEDLCLSSGKLAWCLYIDITCLGYDGNVLDAAVLATLGALSSTKLPKVDLETDSISGFSLSMEGTCLLVNEHPVSTTFAMVSDGKLIVDPTEEEELLAETIFSVVVKPNGDICKVYKPGGKDISDEQLNSSIEKAKTRCTEVLNLLQESLKLAN